MTKLFVDVPDDFPYDWSLGYSGEDSVRIITGVEDAVFICNALARLSDGDLYMVELKDTDCPEFFVLRTGLRLIPMCPELEKRARYYLETEEGDL